MITSSTTLHRLLLTLLATLFCLVLSAQEPDEDTRRYRNGRNMIDEGNYGLALEALRPLTSASNPGTYQAAASFFFAYAAYMDGQPSLAKNMLLQVLRRSPNWKGRDQVLYWLSLLSFEEEQYLQGYEYLNRISNAELKASAQVMKDRFLYSLSDLTLIDSLYQQDEGSAILGEKLAQHIISQPLDSQNTSLLEQLITRHQLDPSRFHVLSAAQSVKKERYQIAVTFPFRYETSPGAFSSRKSLTVSLYEGMQLAREMLLADSIKIDLLAYDTRRDSATTARLIESGELAQVDLIIGPLFPEPAALLHDYAQEQQINIINPLSDNSQIIGSNPFSFLANVVAEQKARLFAEMSRETFQNPNTAIIYGDAVRDSVLAWEYKRLIEQDSFEVVWMEKIPSREARQLFQRLTEEIGEDTLKLTPDSLGHMLVASTNRLLASAAISGVDTRPDTIPLLGFIDWVDIQSLRYDQLERANAFLLASNYLPRNTAAYEQFHVAYYEKYEEYPNHFATIGYDLVHFLGSMLHAHGRYFQVGLRDAPPVRGALSTGYDYSRTNDNRMVSFYQLRKAELVMVEAGDFTFADKRPSLLQTEPEEALDPKEEQETDEGDQ